MNEPFAGVVQRTYAIEGNHVLIIDASYEGEAEIGAWIEVDLAGSAGRAQIKSVAWGSAFDAQSPPLTLVVTGLGGLPEPGSQVRGAKAPKP